MTISSLSDWKYEDNIFCETLSEHLKNYVNSGIIKERTGIDDIEIFQTKMEDTGYQIQRTNPNSGYTWHSDFHTYKSQIENTGVRLLTFIWYLNDIVEGCALVAPRQFIRIFGRLKYGFPKSTGGIGRSVLGV